MRIDAYTHFFPKKFFDKLNEVAGDYKDMGKRIRSLPALFDLDGVRAVPHLMCGRRGADPDSVRVVSAMFRPRHALAGPGFALS